MKLVDHRAPLALALTLVLFPLGLLALVASSGCTRSPAPDRTAPVRAGAILSTMGFALTDDGDPATAAGDLTASFDAPVIDAATWDGTQAGTAHVAFDDEARDLSSATIVDAYPETDIVYAFLYDADVPWRWVVVAAHAPDLTAGASLALDGDAAAAIIVDEETGSAYLTTGGTFTVATAELALGGHLAGDVSGALAEVTLAEWPEALFPFSDDGSELERAAADGSGTFSAAWSERGEAAGSASFTLTVAGFAPFTADAAGAFPLDDVSSAIFLASSSEPERAVVILADTAALVAGAHLVFDGFSTGAWLLEPDGTQVAVVEGALDVTAASLVDGGTVDGSVTLTGEGYVMTGEVYSGEGEGEGEEDCTGIDTLADTFAPTGVYIDSGFAPGEMPEGYDRMLTFTDDGMGLLGLVVATDADLGSYAFASIDFEGRPYPAAVIGLATCSQLIEIESGALSATLTDDNRMTGTLDVTVNGSARTLALDVAIIQ